MMKKRLLVLGVSGLTGYKVANFAKKSFTTFGTYNFRRPDISQIETIQVDVTSKEKIQNIFEEIKPDLVINTTALHNVDFCEENLTATTAVNHKAVEYLYECSEKFGSKLVHLSTDYVFDGLKKTPYLETDTPKPLSNYGSTKLKGEKILENTSHIVIRPSVVYGWTPMELAGQTSSSKKSLNFAMWLLTMLNKNQTLKIVTDQFSTATLADSLAESAVQLATNDESGLFHVSGLSCESRYEFSIKFAKEFGYDTNLITPTDSSQFKQKAKRPSYSCLDCTKAKNLKLNLLTTENALKLMRSQVQKEAPHLLGNLK